MCVMVSIIVTVKEQNCSVIYHQSQRCHQHLIDAMEFPVELDILNFLKDQIFFLNFY